MPNLLGLSLDVNTIGWVLIDSETHQIQGIGTRVFPIGCENFASGKRELSKKAFKRYKKTSRLRYERARKRKIKVVEVLIKHGMCPLSKEAFVEWKKTKRFPVAELREWLQMNPYKLRERAVKEKITKLEIGRIFYQITIHRGFKISDRNSGFKENAMFSGMPKIDRLGILHTEKNTKNQSLGTYLSKILPEEKASYSQHNERIRNRFLAREMFLEETHQIWNFQSNFHHDLLPEVRNELIGDSENDPQELGAVFFQRPLKSQKFRVGRCEFEKNKTKCSVSSLIYQEVLAYRWLNSIKINGNPLDLEDREKVLRYFMTHRKFDFFAIRQLLGHHNVQYNKKDSDLIVGSFINSFLSSSRIFGSRWFDFDEKIKEDIWHSLYFFDHEEKLKEHAQRQWGLDDYQAQAFAKINLDKRYAPISKKAARNILYFLKRGISYDLSVILGGVKNSLGKNWETIAANDIEYIINRVLTLYKENKVFDFIPKLQEFLEEEMHFNAFQINKLYGQSMQASKETVNLFPVGSSADKEIYNFKNPLLINALFQCRKVINEIIKKFGPIDEIKAELSADLKVNKYQHYLHRLDHRRMERLRRKYIEELGKRAENIIPLNLIKFSLWEECKQTCPYTGAYIPLDILFTDQVSVVYIQPWQLSLNDSIWNKTLCMQSFTPNILDVPPYDYFNEHDPENWEMVVKRAARLFSNTKDYPSSHRKFKRFIKKYSHRNFIKHQLEDFNVLSKEVTVYLSKVVSKVSVGPGHSTPHLIEKWRLNQLFDWKTDSEQIIDYHYAAVVAYVNANRRKSYLEILAQQNKYQPQSKKASFPIPYQGFRNDLEYKVNSILVSHKIESKLISKRIQKSVKNDQVFNNICVSVRGSLHKESIYGKRKAPKGAQESYHIRKPLHTFETLHQINKIVDPIVLELVLEALENAGGFNSDRVPRNAFFDIDAKERLIPKVFLPNAKGDPVPIKKVRIKELFNGAVNLKEKINQHVNLRNNHHVLIYIDKDGVYQEEVVSFWEGVRRYRQREPIYQLPEDGAQFVTTLQINDLFILGLEDLEIPIDQESKSFLAKHLYRVQKLSSKFYEFRLVNDLFLSSTDTPAYVRINNFGSRKTGWQTYNPHKVALNAIGDLIAVKRDITIMNQIKNLV